MSVTININDTPLVCLHRNGSETLGTVRILFTRWLASTFAVWNVSARKHSALTLLQ